MSAPSESRPVIAVSAALEQARWAVWDLPAALVATNYLDAVVAAGGLPLMFAPDAGLAADPDPVLDRVDGVLLLGGPDVDPSRYGAERTGETEPSVPLRDAVEIALVTAASQRDIPLLGICRGMQVINVARGGTIEQHLPARLGDDEHRRAKGTFAGNEHAVVLAEGSLAARSSGGETARIHSHHHQAVAEVGEGLSITGRAPDDVPEALEDPGCRYLLGVQWHPEADGTSGVIASLVAEAGKG